MQSRYGPKKEHLYNFWSSDSQNQVAFLRTLSAFDFSSGRTSSFKNSIMGSIQLGLILTWWTCTISTFLSVGLHKSSTRMNRGKLCAEEVASVVRESTCVFPLLGTCNKLKDLNPACKHLTWPRYPYILSSLTSNSPFTWPTTNLKSENISIVFPPILYTMTIPISRVSYSASLFVAKNLNLNDFSMVIFSGETRTSPTPNRLWFAALSTYTFHTKGSCRVIVPTDFPSMCCVSTSFSYRDSANLATKSTRTWPLTEVQGMYLMLKASRIVPYLAILPV